MSAAEDERVQWELAAAARQHTTDEADKARVFTAINEDRKFKLDRQKLQLEYDRLLDAKGASSQHRAAALKVVHDKRAEEARLIHLFFDKLVSTRKSERDVAMLALSTVIDPELIKRLVLAGRAVSRRAQPAAQREDEVEKQPPGPEERASDTAPAPAPEASAPQPRRIIEVGTGPYAIARWEEIQEETQPFMTLDDTPRVSEAGSHNTTTKPKK